MNIYSLYYIMDNQTTNCDTNVYKKLNFLYNALEHGWSIKKQEGCYIFSKKHQNRREVFSNDYLEKFVIENNKPTLV